MFSFQWSNRAALIHKQLCRWLSPRSLIHNPESPFSAPIQGNCIAPEVDWNSKRMSMPKNQAIAVKSRAIHHRPPFLMRLTTNSNSATPPQNAESTCPFR